MTARHTFHLQRASRRGGFTLIEVLSALLIMAIVIPVIMRGIAFAQAAADNGRHRAEAAGLAQMELAQILASESWQNGGLSGDFSPDFPGYSWAAAVAPWPGDSVGAGLDEIDMTVSWRGFGKEQSLVMSTLAYPRNSTSTATSTGSTATP